MSEMSLNIAIENVRLLLKMIRDPSKKIDALKSVLEVALSFGPIDPLLEIVKSEESPDTEELYSTLAITCAYEGHYDLFSKYLEKVSEEYRPEVISEAILGGKLDNNALMGIVKDFLKRLKKVDYSDEDLCFNLAVVFSFIGDFTRARGFVNSFCLLIKNKEYTIMEVFFRVMDELKCAHLRILIGDRNDGLRSIQKLLDRIERLNPTQKSTILLSTCDILSRHGFHDEALAIIRRFSKEVKVGPILGVVIENILQKNTDRETLDRVLKQINTVIGSDPEACIQIAVALRKHNIDRWKEFFERIKIEELEKIDIGVLLDIMETLADNNFLDMLEKVSEIPIYWEDLKRNQELLFKYIYTLYASGRIRGGAKILEDYINSVIISGRKELHPSLPAYYLKSFLVAKDKFPEELAEVGLEEKLNKKLKLLERERVLPISVERILSDISNPKYKNRAVERVAEEILLESHCVAMDRIQVLIPEKERLEELIVRVAKRLMMEGEVVDALSCLDVIDDKKRKLDVLLAMEHRCALKLCRELPRLLKMTIKTINELKGKMEIDPAEEAKIRLDLAIAFKFAGKKDEYLDSINKAVRMLKGLKPRNPNDIRSNRVAAEIYGYYAATLYVLGDPRSDELLKESLNYINMLPSRLRLRTLIKIMTWLLFADWFSVIFQLVRLEGIEPILPLVRRTLIDEYVRNERYDEALETALSLAVSAKDMIDTYIHYAKVILNTPVKRKILDILAKAWDEREKIDDEIEKMVYGLRIAEVYARAGVINKAEEIVNSILDKAYSLDDVEKKDMLLAEIAPIYYVIESSKEGHAI